MKLKNTLILFIILVVLGGYFYFVEIKQHNKEQKVEEQQKQVFTFEKDSIAALTVKNKNGTFVIKKIQDEWRLTDPLYTGTDKNTVNSMLNNLNNAKKDKEFSIKPAELREYGLDKRAIRVTVGLTDGTIDTLWFGDKTPVGSFVFANLSDSTVFTTNENIKNSFDKNLFEIRDKNLLHFDRNKISKVTVHNPKNTIEFEKTGNNEWKILNIDRPADNAKINPFISHLMDNAAKSFVDEEGTQLKKYGLARPKYEVELQMGPESGQAKLMVSGMIDGKYYAKDVSRKPIFEIDSTVVKDLKQDVSDYRDTDFAKFERQKVNRIEVAYSDTAFTVAKDTSNNWWLEDSAKEAVQTPKVTSFFSNLDFTKISEFVADGKYSAKRYGLDNPGLKLKLFNDAELILTAEFGKFKDDQVYAKTDRYDSVYLIPKTKFKQLKLKPADIVKEKPKPVPAKADSVS